MNYQESPERPPEMTHQEKLRPVKVPTLEDLPE